jgi:hypothetical protein
MQQTLKPASGAARAEIVAAELLAQLDVAMDDAPAALDLRFRGEGLPPLTRDVESRGGRRNRDARAWHTSIKKSGRSPRAVPYHRVRARANLRCRAALKRREAAQTTSASVPVELPLGDQLRRFRLGIGGDAARRAGRALANWAVKAICARIQNRLLAAWLVRRETMSQSSAIVSVMGAVSGAAAGLVAAASRPVHRFQRPPACYPKQYYIRTIYGASAPALRPKKLFP